MTNPIDTQIDDLPMHDMETIDALASIDPNSLKARLERKRIRYFLYCLRSMDQGKEGPEDIPADLIGKITLQKGFTGWHNFAVNWDVALNNPYKVVSRQYSEEEEWERVVMAKFPQIKPDGNVEYPDMDVKKAVDEEASTR